MTPEEIIEKIDTVISEFSNKFEGSLNSIQKEIYDNVVNEITKLDRSGDSIKTSVNNLKQVSKINSNIDSIVLNTDYINNLNEYVKGFNEVQTLMNTYFSAINTSFEVKKVYDAIRILNIETTVESLTQAGLKQALETPIKNILNQSVVNGLSYKELQQSLKIEILGQPKELGGLERYVSQITHDALYQYQGNYIKAVTDDLDFEWFLYQGGKQITSRCFCLERVGRYFHKSEVSLWGKTPSLWDSCKTKKNKGGGRIPETNEKTIYTYRGGYNCRHQILPVDELVVPEIDKKRLLN
jgi:hypothetical protein